MTHPCMTHSIPTPVAFPHGCMAAQETVSWESRYVGDVRVINAGLLDAYLLKSLDGAPSAGLETKGLSIFKCGRDQNGDQSKFCIFHEGPSRGVISLGNRFASHAESHASRIDGPLLPGFCLVSRLGRLVPHPELPGRGFSLCLLHVQVARTHHARRGSKKDGAC